MKNNYENSKIFRQITSCLSSCQYLQLLILHCNDSVWKMRKKISFKKFSWNHFVAELFLGKILILRNFCSRIVSKFNYHSTVWKLQKFCLILFSQKFRESNGLIKLLIWRFFLSVRDNFSFFLSLSPQSFFAKISWNHGFTKKEITKYCIWRFFFSVRENFSFFHYVHNTVRVGKW